MLVEVFHFVAGPLGLAEEFEARFDAWIFGKTINPNPAGHVIPAIEIDQLIEHRL